MGWLVLGRAGGHIASRFPGAVLVVIGIAVVAAKGDGCIEELPDDDRPAAITTTVGDPADLPPAPPASSEPQR